MNKRDQHRKQRLRGLIDTRYEGSQLDFSKASGLTEGRISQLLDPSLPFGQRAAFNLVERLGLADDYFDAGTSVEQDNGNILLHQYNTGGKMVMAWCCVTSRESSKVGACHRNGCA